MTRSTFKTLLILIVFVVATIFPIGKIQTFKITFWTCVASFIIATVIPNLLIVGGLRNRVITKKPKWTDQLKFKYPMTYIQFISFLLIAAGIGGLVGGLINKSFYNCFF